METEDGEVIGSKVVIETNATDEVLLPPPPVPADVEGDLEAAVKKQPAQVPIARHFLASKGNKVRQHGPVDDFSQKLDFPRKKKRLDTDFVEDSLSQGLEEVKMETEDGEVIGSKVVFGTNATDVALLPHPPVAAGVDEDLEPAFKKPPA